jgi:hypothetical protein
VATGKATVKMRVFFALLLTVTLADVACAQNPAGKAAPAPEYRTAAAALEALRAKDGVKISAGSGWTVIEDQSTLSVWSFTPSGHPAFPAAVHRQVIQEGNNLFVKMNVLCEAPKAACDTMVAEFQKLNGQVRDDLKR